MVPFENEVAEEPFLVLFLLVRRRSKVHLAGSWAQRGLMKSVSTGSSSPIDQSLIAVDEPGGAQAVQKGATLETFVAHILCNVKV